EVKCRVGGRPDNVAAVLADGLMGEPPLFSDLRNRQAVREVRPDEFCAALEAARQKCGHLSLAHDGDEGIIATDRLFCLVRRIFRIGGLREGAASVTALQRVNAGATGKEVL